MEIKRTKAQNAVIKNRGGCLLVSAAAGSGKTSVLVERLLDRIETEQRRIDEFLIITFTKAAAEELRTRIARALSQKLQEDPTNLHLRRQTLLLYQTQISTIHSLCTVILREWGHIIDLPVDFSLLEEDDAKILMLQTLNDLLEERYETIRPDGEFTKLLDILSAGRDDSRLVEIILDVYGRMQSHPNPFQLMEEQKMLLSLDHLKEAGETIWGQLLLCDTEQVVTYWIKELSSAITLAQEDESLSVYVDSLSITYLALQHLQTATKKGWSATSEACQVPFPRLKAVRNCQNQHLQDHIKLIRSNCKEAIDSLKIRFLSSSQELVADLKLLYPAMKGLFNLVREFSELYQKEKMRKGKLDFSDLEHKTVSLLIGENELPTEIAEQIGSRFAEIMVDEYQDTNQVQNTIFMALSQEGQNLFLVGDVKQSIYRFRLADPSIFLEKYRRFLPYELAKAGQERKILLSQNFRSRPEVLDAVNYLFRNIMSEELGEMYYTKEDALYAGGSFPAGNGYETELHVLNFEEMSLEHTDKLPGKHELESRYVASEILKLLQDEFLISDGNGGKRPISTEDIVILLRSPGSVRHLYEKALRELQIPFASEGNNDFFETTEVSVMLSYLRILDNPKQDVSLLSVLHSPLYGFDGERLAQIRQVKEGDIYSALIAASETGMEDCRSFLTELNDLRFELGEISCHELIWKIYQETNALEIFSRMPGGKKREENLLAFYELACRFEDSGHRGLFGFLLHVSKLEESGALISKGGAGEQSGVKILSIHRSKGLEYPVVFLCGLGKRFNYSDIQKPVLFHSKLGLGPRGVDSEKMVEFQTLPRQAVALQMKKEMLAEEMRLLYVAMTRAKDKLIMTHALSYGESELKKLIPYVTCPINPNVLANCSCVGQWVIIAAMARPEGAVLRNISEGNFFHPNEDLGLPWRVMYQKGIPAVSGKEFHSVKEMKSVEKPLSKETLWELLNWRYPYEKFASIAAKVTATQLTAEISLEGKSKEAESNHHTFTKDTFRRPRFAEKEIGLTPAEKGTALHTVLQSIRLEHTDSVESIKEEINRLLVENYITTKEADTIDPQKLYCFFDSYLGREMRQAKSLHREFPFSILIPADLYYKEVPSEETLLLQGVIDCWYETPRGITLVDFKTNHVSLQKAEEKAEFYRKQMEAYAFALEEMTNKPVIHKILWFLTPNCGIEVGLDGTLKKT